MSRTKHTKVSKFIAYALRHNPAVLELELDEAGWTDVGIFLTRLNAHKGASLSLDDLQGIVDADSKGRYTIKGGRIRANQGHSIDVQAVDLTPKVPPPRLYHGTTEERFVKITESGALRPMKRHHVHLAGEAATARSVGQRHRGETFLMLHIDAAAMQAEGFAFFVSDNGVWLTDEVPLRFVAPQRP